MEGATGPTVSATELARLTGVSRERLRTWERRHGFPVPVRAGGGRRRYDLADVAPVIAVRRAVDAGTPLHVAIGAATALAGEAPPGAAAFAGVIEAAPGPVVLISGPDPARVVLANAAARGVPGAPLPGEWLADDLAGHLAPAFAVRGASRFERRSWQPPGVAVPCLGVPIDDAGRTLLALFDLETAEAQAERTLMALAEAELTEAREALAEREAALGLVLAAAGELRDRGGVEVVGATLDLLVRRLGLVDAALAPYMAGEILLGRSARGLLGPEMLPVAGQPGVAAAVRDGQVSDLSRLEAAALGVPEGLAAIAVPARGAGEPLGVLVLVCEDPALVAPSLRHALLAVGTVLGLTLLQERLLGDAANRGG